MFEIQCSNLTVKTPQKPHLLHSGVYIIKGYEASFNSNNSIVSYLLEHKIMIRFFKFFL